MQAFIRAPFIAVALLLFANLGLSVAQDELELRFRECTPGLIHHNNAAASASNDSAITQRFKAAVADGGMLIPLLLAAVAGLLTALSPCVYPLIPITLSIMGARSYRNAWHGFLVSATYVAGMGLVYTALGTTFAYLGLLAGSIMQNPIFLVAVAILFIVLALSMFGAFDVIVPASLLKRLSRIGGQGYRGAFLMGLVAGIIAAPCTGPVLGFIFTIIASNQNIFLGTSLMLAFSGGLGLPFLLLGTFSSSFSRIPKSGPWMTGIKWVFGVCMLAASFYYLSLAYRPLGHLFAKEQPLPVEAVAWHELNAKNTESYSFDRLLKLAQAQCRPMLIDFYADWCIACKQLDAITFKDAGVSKVLQDFFLVRIDSSQSSEHLANIQNRYGVTGLPTVLIIDQRGELLEGDRILGFVPPEQFIKTIEQLSSNHH